MEIRHFDDTENKNYLSQSFDRARAAITSTLDDPEFLDLLRSYGLRPDDHDKPAYWTAQAQYQWDKAQEEGVSGYDSYVQIIAGSLPDAVLHSAELDRHDIGPDAAHEHKLRLSEYNSLIRDFAANYPGISASELMDELRKVAAITVAGVSKRLQSEALSVTNSVVRGAQHELAFRKILESSGLEFGETTPEQDLKGADYFVTAPDGNVVQIDVKASLSEIDHKNHGSNRTPYSINHKGDITMWSCVTDHELNDGFTISKEEAEKRVPLLLVALQKSVLRKSA